MLMIYYSEQNELKLNFTKAVGHPCEIIITPWDRGICWSSIADGTIQECDWSKNLEIPLFLLMNEPDATAWLKHMPDSLVLHLLDFETIYPDLVFSAMWFASRYPQAIDLLKNFPLLLALILLSAKQNRWDQQAVIALLSTKRCQILAACGLQGTKTSLQLLKKLVVPKFTAKELNILQQLSTDKLFNQLNHLKYLDFTLLDFLIHNPLLTPSRFFLGYDAEWPWNKFLHLHSEIIRMADICNWQDIETAIISCHTLQMLHNLHDRLAKRISNNVESFPVSYFPAPPLTGTDHIVPLTNSRQLLIEGREQHHCVASFLQKIKTQEYYVYKVTAPERATLGLKIMDQNQIVLDQLKLCGNEEPAEETRIMVNSWIPNAHLQNHGSL